MTSGGAVPGGPRTILRRILRGVLIGVAVVAGVITTFLIALQVDAFGTWVARRAASWIAPPGISIHVDRVSGSWIRSLRVAGLRVSTSADTTVSVDTIAASYRLLPLLRRRVDVRSVRVTTPVLRLARGADGAVGLQGWPAEEEQPPESPGGRSWSIAVASVDVGGAAGRLTTPAGPGGGERDVVFSWSDVGLALHDIELGQRMALVLDEATGAVDVPALPAGAGVGPVDFRMAADLADRRVDVGTFSLSGPRTSATGGGTLGLPASTGDALAVDFDLAVDSLPLAIVHALLGNEPDPAARLSATVAVGGSTHYLTADLDVRTSDGGRVRGTAAVAPAGEPVRYMTAIEVMDLDPATLTGDTALAGAINGSIDLALEGADAAALGGHADATFEALRVGPAALRSARLESSWVDGLADVQIRVAGDAVEGGVTGTIRPFDAEPAYDLAGPFDFRVAGDSVDRLRFAGTGRVTGAGFDVQNARATLDVDLSTIAILAVQLGPGHVAAALDTGHVAFRLDAGGASVGTVAASGSAAFGDAIEFRLDRAAVRDLDVAALLGDSVPSRVDADFTASGEVGAPERLRSDFTVAVRDGRYGPVRIDTGMVAGRIADGRLAASGRVRSDLGGLDLELAGQPFRDVPEFEIRRGTFAALDLGVLSGDSALSTAIGGSLTGTVRGLDPAALALNLAVSLDTSRINALVIEAGDLGVSMRNGRIDLDADLALQDSGSLGADLGVEPLLDMPSVEIRSVSFRAFDPFRAAGATTATASLNGDITGRLTGFDPASMQAGGALRLDPSLINDESIEAGRVDWRIAGQRLTTKADIDLGSGSLNADATVTFGEAAIGYTLEAALRTDRPGRLAGFDNLDGSVAAALSVDGRGTTPATMRTQVHFVADSAALGGVRVDTMRVAVRIADGMARFDTLTIRSNLADVTGGGAVPVDSLIGAGADLSIAARVHSLEPLDEWVAGPIGIGTGEIDVAFTGPAEAVRFDASLTASALLLGESRLVGLRSAAQGELGKGFALQSATGTVDLDRWLVSGIEVRVSHADIGYDGEAISLAANATVDDRRDVDLAIRVDPRRDARSAVLERLDFRADEDRWQLSGQPVISWAAGIRVDSLMLRAGDQSVSIDGLLDTADRSDMRARIGSFRIGSIADLAGFDDLDGTVTASFDLQGSAAEPRLTGGIDARLDWRNGRESSIVATVEYDTLRLGVDAAIRTDRGGALTVQGGLPIDLALTRTAEGDTTRLTAAAPGSVDLIVRADSFGIEWVEPFLDPMTAQGLGGRLQIDARVGGTQADPTLNGSVRLLGGRLTVPRLGVTYENASADIMLDGRLARIENATATAGDGAITATGTLTLAELSLGEFDIEARMDRFRAIHDDAFRVRVSGTVGLSGTTREPRINGQLQLVETDVYLGDRVRAASVRPVELTDEQIRQLEEYFGIPVRPPARDPSALFDALQIDLAIAMSRDTWVRQRANPQLEIQLTGDVRVTKEPRDSLQFDGTIEAVSRRSYVEQFGKRFRIERGVVDLRGKASESLINIRAAYLVPSTRDPNEPEVTITLDVQGTLDDLSLTLGSEPEMENADIVSYLATGRPAASSLDFQQNGDGGLGTIGSEFALGQVTGLVEGLASESIGLDVVEIRPDGLRGATLIAGRYITPTVYVGFKQPIGRDPNNPDTHNEFERTEVELEYQALRWLLLNMEASNSAVSLLFRYRYAY